MESLLKRILIPAFFVCLVFSILPIPRVKASYGFTFYGGFYDNGKYAGAVNCTLWRENQEPLHFTLEGSYTAGALQLPAILQIHLAYNESRTLYLLEEGSYYIFVPEEGNVYTYYFQILDFVGITEGGYIETWLNVNGTLRLVERQSLRLMNDIPFQMSWSYTYWIAIYHPELGRAFVNPFVAKSKTTYLIGITEELFPRRLPSTAGITRYCARNNATWMFFYYSDIYDRTYWVQFSIYEVKGSAPIFTLNTTEPASLNYYDLNPRVSYIGKIRVRHEILGLTEWSWVFPAVEREARVENPFVFLENYGRFVFPLRYLPAVLMVLAVFMVFSWWNLPVGIVAGYLFAAFFVYLGWLPISWDWLWISGTISFIIAFSMAKEREGVMY